MRRTKPASCTRQMPRALLLRTTGIHSLATIFILSSLPWLMWAIGYRDVVMENLLKGSKVDKLD
jgi:hypothetical protein